MIKLPKFPRYTPNWLWNLEIQKKNWEKNFTDFFFSETYIFYAFPFQGVAGLVINAQRFCNAIVAGDTSTVANIANVQVVVPATKLRLK
jgi:hypothetical protein